MICVNVFYVFRNESSAGYDKRHIVSPYIFPIDPYCKNWQLWQRHRHFQKVCWTNSSLPPCIYYYFYCCLALITFIKFGISLIWAFSNFISCFQLLPLFLSRARTNRNRTSEIFCFERCKPVNHIRPELPVDDAE